MKINTLFLDLDGTILSRTKRISSNNLKALEKYYKMGGNVVICTGRQYESCKKYKYLFEDISNKRILYTINLNGAYIRDMYGTLIYKQVLKHSLVKQLLELAKKFRIKFLIYPSNPKYHEHLFTNSICEHITSKIYYRKSPISFDNDSDLQAFKINFISAFPKRLKRFYNELKNLYGDKISQCYSSKHMFEVTDVRATKGNAIEYLLSLLNLNAKECAVIGDNENDISAFNVIRTSCALTNNENIGKYASFVYPKRNGVAKFINEQICVDLTANVKLIATDLDGTLYTKDKTIDKQTIEAIKDSYGIYKIPYFCLATGRSVLDSYGVIKKLGIPERGAYIIGNNGSVIFDVNKKKVIRFIGIDEKSARAIITLIKKYNEKKDEIIGLIHNWNEKLTVLGIESGGEIYPNDYSFNPKKFINLLNSMSSGFFHQYNKAKRILDIDCIEGHYNVSKFVIYIKNQKKYESFYKDLKKLNLPIEITTSGKNNYEILPPNVSKGTSLKFLMKQLGVKPNELLSVGDEENDIPMLRITPWSYTLAKSKVLVRQMSNKIINSSPSIVVKQAIDDYKKEFHK